MFIVITLFLETYLDTNACFHVSMGNIGCSFPNFMQINLANDVLVKRFIRQFYVTITAMSKHIDMRGLDCLNMFP